MGVFCSWHRVRGRLRRPCALAWEQGRPRRYWAAGGDRGAADVARRQSVRAEHGAASRELPRRVFYDVLK
eukprot:8130072-Pyramimonas_sp.AAC.1